MNLNLLYLVHWHWQEIRDFVYRKEQTRPKRIAETKVASICWQRSRWQPAPSLNLYLLFPVKKKAYFGQNLLLFVQNLEEHSKQSTYLSVKLIKKMISTGFWIFFRHKSVSNNEWALGRWPPIRCQIQLDVRLKKHQELIQATKLSGWQPDSSKKIYFLREFTMPVNSPEMSNEPECL